MSQTTTKVRFVRCPRCRQVLPELPGVKLYQCGGCGTILQAKIIENETKDTISSSDKPDADPKNELKHVVEENEASSTSQKVTAPSTNEPASDPSSGSEEEEKEVEDCERDRDEEIEPSTHRASPTGLSCHENEEQSLEVDEKQNSSEQKSGENQNEFNDCPGNMIVSNEQSSSTVLSFHKNDERDHNKFGDCNGDQNEENEQNCEETEDRENGNSPNIELNRQESEEPSPVAGTHIEMHINENSSENENERNQNEFGDSNKVPSDIVNVSDDITSSRKDNSYNSGHASLRKSSTAKSFYTCASSEFSYDGDEDQVPDQHQNVSFLNTKGLSKVDEYMIDDTIASDSEMEYHRRYTSSISSEKQYYQDEWSKPIGVRISRSPLGYEYGSPLSYGHNDSACSSSFRSPDKTTHLEQEKTELLRMVYNLQTELNRLQIPKENSTHKEKKIPSYYDHVSPEIYTSHSSQFPRYVGRPSHGKISRMPFSEEITTSRDRAKYNTNSHYCPRNSYYSAELPPSHIYNSGEYTSQTGYSSPQRFSSSEMSSWSYDTKSREPKNLKILKERRNVKWRHFRPIAGGAPFVACYRCSNLLQLPADFLLFKRKYHKLKCSACSEILKFSLKNKVQIVPYTPDDAIAIAPPFGTRELNSKVSENFELAGPSSKMSEIEEVHPRTGGSPLHRLMGYSSPSQVIRG